MVDRASIQLPMETPDIERCIPHRPPFLLIDRVTELNPGERIVATKCVSISDPILQGHFPGNPVVPGVLIVEGIAQAAAVFGQLSTEKDNSLFLLTEVSAARFRKPVIPGDQLVYDVKAEKMRRGFFWFSAQAMVSSETVAEVKFSARMT